MMHALPRMRMHRTALVASALWSIACRRRVHTGAAHTDARTLASGALPMRPVAGMYWGRVGELPDGMRARVWLDGDGRRIRGAYESTPWTGEIEGRAEGTAGYACVLHERGVTQSIGARERVVHLRWDGSHTTLAGRDDGGRDVELVRANFPVGTLREGIWLAHWTGLPPGLVVQTRLAHDPDDHWRALYAYTGPGGRREGSFDGTVERDTGVLAIAWTEIAPDGGIARGTGRLAPGTNGLRGTYGIAGHDEGLGEWTLEPYAR